MAFGDQAQGAPPSGGASPAKLREALDLLRSACTSPSSRQALRTVEADVLQGDTSKASAPSGASRDTPGAKSRGVPPQFLKH